MFMEVSEVMIVYVSKEFGKITTYHSHHATLYLVTSALSEISTSYNVFGKFAITVSQEEKQRNF